MKEYLLTTDNFMNPKVLDGTDATGVLLIRLLELIPGTNPLHPGMGVGVGTRWKYLLEDDIVDLEQEVAYQIETYLPPVFQNVRVQISINTDSTLVIAMLLDNTSYIYDSSLTTNTLYFNDISNDN